MSYLSTDTKVIGRFLIAANEAGANHEFYRFLSENKPLFEEFVSLVKRRKDNLDVNFCDWTQLPSFMSEYIKKGWSRRKVIPVYQAKPSLYLTNILGDTYHWKEGLFLGLGELARNNPACQLGVGHIEQVLKVRDKIIKSWEEYPILFPADVWIDKDGRQFIFGIRYNNSWIPDVFSLDEEHPETNFQVLQIMKR